VRAGWESIPLAEAISVRTASAPFSRQMSRKMASVMPAIGARMSFPLNSIALIYHPFSTGPTDPRTGRRGPGFSGFPLDLPRKKCY
jgi:hypothetical protein